MSAAAASGKSVTLLLVDDNPLVRNLIEKGLEPVCEVIIAADGARVFANVLVLGFVAGQIQGADPAFFDSMRPGEVPPGNPRPISDLAGLGPIASVHIFGRGKGADDAGTD